MEEYIKATLFTSREVGDGEVWLSSVLPQRQIVGGNSWLAPIGQKQQQRRHRQRDKRAWKGKSSQSLSASLFPVSQCVLREQENS